jgi:hypothetical protein
MDEWILKVGKEDTGANEALHFNHPPDCVVNQEVVKDEGKDNLLGKNTQVSGEGETQMTFVVRYLDSHPSVTAAPQWLNPLLRW